MILLSSESAFEQTPQTTIAEMYMIAECHRRVSMILIGVQLQEGRLPYDVMHLLCITHVLVCRVGAVVGRSLRLHAGASMFAV